MFLISKGLSFFSSSPRQIPQWTSSSTSEIVRTMLSVWTQLPFVSADFNLNFIEEKLEQCLTETAGVDFAQFQLACVYWDMKELLGIQTDEPMPILEHLKYIRASFSGFKEAKESVLQLEIQLMQKESECKILQQEQDKLQSERNGLEQEKRLLQQANEQLEQEKDEFQQEGKRLQRVKDELQQAGNRLLQATDEFQHEKKRLQLAKDEFQLEVKRLQQAKEELHRKLLCSEDASARKILQLEQLLKDSQGALNQAKIENCTLTKTMQSQLLDCKKQIEMKNSEIQAGKQSRSSLQAQLNTAIQKSTSLQNSSQKMTALKNQLTEANRQTQGLRLELQEANARCVSRENDVCVYSQQIVELNDSLQVAKQQKAKLEADLAKAQQAFQQSQKAHTTLKKQFTSIQKNAENKAKECIRISQTVKEWEQREQELSSREVKLWEGVDLNLTCVVCLEFPPGVTFFPCRHACACNACSRKLSTCPKCRSDIERREKIYL